MTLREMLADWWCKFSLSMTEYCQDRFGVLPNQVTWIDFTLGELKWKIYTTKNMNNITSMHWNNF